MDPLSQQRFLQERKAAKRKAFLQHQAASKALKAAAGAAARQSAPAPAPIAQPAQPIAYALGCAVVRVAREAGTRQSFVSLSKLGFKLRKDEAVRQALPNSKLGEYLSTSLPARDFNVTLTGKTPGVLVRKHAWQKYSSTPANVPADGAPVLHESAPLQSTLQPPDGGFAETPATGLPEPSRFAPHPTHPQPHQLSQYSLAPQSTLGAPVQVSRMVQLPSAQPSTSSNSICQVYLHMWPWMDQNLQCVHQAVRCRLCATAGDTSACMHGMLIP